ncbi:MAG: PQQ-dependent sugar dehydrogenase [Verrucomicrobiota bacterium]
MFRHRRLSCRQLLWGCLSSLVFLSAIFVETSHAAPPGLDAPEAIGPFLDNKFPTREPVGQNIWSVQETYLGININLPMHVMPYPGTNKLLSVAKEGRIFLFNDDAAATQLDTFLDLRSSVFTNSDCGMTWLVFHPEFGQVGSPNGSFVYITYKWKPVIGGNGSEAFWRLSRFSVIEQNGKPVADPASEQILIQQYDRQQWHDSGCMMFGPDGYLYVGIGDEGGANDQYGNGQKLDERLFSGMLRIDVDEKPESLPVVRQPTQLPMPAGWPNSFTAHYKIPADNPFYDAAGGRLGEFYAIGLRNPYRFSRDPVSGQTWIGDVGQDSREEVDILVAGGNYGWPFREGRIARPTGPAPVIPSPIVGSLQEPVWDSPHGVDGCVVGGFVYRGAAHPSLVGKFISVDNVNSHIRAHVMEGHYGVNQILTTMPSGSVYSGTSTIGWDAAGEPIFVKVNGTNTRGRFFKLANTVIPPTAEPPALLSQTGAFADLATLTPSPGVIPYTVNAPLWSDGAEKLRWIALPNNGSHDSPAEKISFEAEGNWNFPSGTVIIKHFALPVDDNDPAILRRLETRFIIIPTSGEPYGLTYKWREDGSDADLLPGGLSEQISIAEVGGGTREQTWDYPSRSDCRVCHNGNTGHVLGVRTHQLNGDLTYPKTGRTANQLETLGALGWFDNAFRADLVPWMLQSQPLTENSASLTERVRSYLDSNCSQCHRPGGVRAFFDARFTTPLDEQGIIHGALENDLGDGENRLIAPGSTEHSVMLQRIGALSQLKMPPLAKHLVDPTAMQVFTEWINSLDGGPAVGLTTSSPPNGPFDLAVHFSQPVTGLTVSDFTITGATASSLTGSGADYVLSITPAGFGEVTVKLPADRVENGAALGNYASALFSVDITDSSLVAWLKLDDAAGSLAADSSSFGNHGGTLVGMSPSNWVSGHFGGALQFNATGQRVTMDNVIGADFSVSFWMKSTMAFPYTNSPFAGAAFFYADMPGASNDFSIGGTRSIGGLNRISFQTSKLGASNITLHSTIPVTDGQWHHIVVTRSQLGLDMKIYVDGLLNVTAPGTDAILNGNPVIAIGSAPGVATTLYNGMLDEIRLYTTVLGEAEVTALAAGPPPASPYNQWVDSWLPGLYHLQAPDTDIEGDGLTNFGEFAFGGDPVVWDVIPVPLERAEDGSVTLQYRARKAAVGAVYQIEVSGTLGNWLDATPDITSTTVTEIPGTDYAWVTVVYMPPLASPESLFFRVRASP